ncbi:coiled-coil domain-containing protein 92-like [Myxocyprinus asiaticus]|uniref:coiled-coil domain-containing protein 92-like n=1 Tax=Myxocyprinus asiaticus TaxID=70543 RepID=UPI002221E4A6|nr:coiled-coil domain-containing protein 92-like [Myxocyprinus asiaticus]XP_051534029.1 coiled-coil domain-containing protein 92-like [Myxocyprinus asiaticus]
MDRSTVAEQVENVERNVSFLQQEHRILLTGLCLEIRNLKKRCNDLSCYLSERPPVRSREEIALEEELLQERLLETEQHLAEQESALVELRGELRKKGALASALQVRLRDEERRFLEELKRRSHKIMTLSRDLCKQTDVAAQLSFQLHSAHFRLYHQTEDNEEEEEKAEDEGGAMQESDWAASSPWASPVAAESSRQSRASGRMRRSEKVRECVPRERVLGPEEPRPMPDPALFLYPFRHRLLPLHRSLGGRWREGGLSETQIGRFRDRPLREDIGAETTEL